MSSSASRSVLVVGAGCTGSGLAYYLSKQPSSSKVGLTVWDKARGPGGRFATLRSREPGLAILDTGAQYITRGAGGTPADAELYSELQSHGVIQPLCGTVENARPEHTKHEQYVASSGMSSISQHLLATAGATVEYERRVHELSVAGDAQQWRVTDTDGRSELFDAVVLTLPTPQLLELQGETLRSLLAPHHEALSRVASRYSSRYAACAWYDESAWPIFAALPWASKYVRGSSSLVYVSVEPKKRELEAASAPAVLLHSSVPYALAHMDAAADEVLAEMLADLGKEVGGLPSPTKTKLHRWRYSQVPPPATELNGGTGVVPGAEGGAMLLGGAGAGALVLAGDGLVGSNFDNTMHSARSACALVVEHCV